MCCSYDSGKTGYQATVTIHNAAWDITVDIPDRPVRVEVKSSLLNYKRPYGTTYSFQNIKFENFDYLVVVFVTPRGTIEKWATKEDLQEFFSDKKRHGNGYTLATATHLIPDFFQEMEDFPYGN